MKLKRTYLYARQRKLKRRRQFLYATLTIVSFVLVYIFWFYLFTPQKPELPKKTPKARVAGTRVKKKRIQQKTISIIAVGDIQFARNVSVIIKREGGTAPLALVAENLKDADLTIANLESPLSTRGVRLRGKDVVLRGNPQGIVGMKNAGIDVVTLANNHALDYGPQALEDTLSLLNQNKIAHAGAGLNSEQALKPARLKVSGNNISFLGYSYILPPGFLPNQNKAGVAPARPDRQAIAKQIKEEKEKSDFVICYYHWGLEYQDYPIKAQKSLAHFSIDSGADLVLGSHPHVIQGIELYKGKLIAYSLGDFVFDHYSRKTGEAFILKCEVTSTKGTQNIKVIPVYLTSSGKPQLVQGYKASTILNRLKTISSPFGTQITIQENEGTVNKQ